MNGLVIAYFGLLLDTLACYYIHGLLQVCKRVQTHFFSLIKLPTNVHRIHVKMEGFALTSIWPSRVNVSLGGKGVFARKVRYN